MRKSKDRKHEKTRARTESKAHCKAHGLTSKSTKNRRARNIMDTLSIPYVIIDGIVNTYRALIL